MDVTTPALWTKHRPLAHRLADQYRIPGLDRDDVRQEALEALWKASRSHDPQLGPFTAWATRIIRARLVTLLRAATNPKRFGPTVELSDHAAPDPGRQLQDIVDLLPTLTQLERDAIAARLKGTYSSKNRSQENALQSARRKLRQAA